MAEPQIVQGPLKVLGPVMALGGMMGPNQAEASTPLQTIRKRFTTAQVNAGATVLFALTGRKFRVVDAIMIAIGGNAGGATSVRLAGTQASSTVQLVTHLIAVLTQSTPARIDLAANVLADGASFLACDVNTPITINANGTLTTATAVDVVLTYAMEGV